MKVSSVVKRTVSNVLVGFMSANEYDTDKNKYFVKPKTILGHIFYVFTCSKEMTVMINLSGLLPCFIKKCCSSAKIHDRSSREPEKKDFLCILSKVV